MTDRTTIALPRQTFDDLEAEKPPEAAWPEFVREQVLPALDENESEAIDYAEIESRCQSAIEAELEGRHR